MVKVPARHFSPPHLALERVPISLNRERALDSLRGRIFCGKPVSTFPENALTPWSGVPYRARCGLERVAIWLRRRLAERLGSATYAAEANIASKLILPRTIRILATHHKPWRKLLGGISALQNICGFGFAQLFARLPSCQKRFIATKRE